MDYKIIKEIYGIDYSDRNMIFCPNTMSPIIQCYKIYDGSIEWWTLEDHNIVWNLCKENHLKTRDFLYSKLNYKEYTLKETIKFYKLIIDYYYLNKT